MRYFILILSIVSCSLNKENKREEFKISPDVDTLSLRIPNGKVKIQVDNALDSIDVSFVKMAWAWTEKGALRRMKSIKVKKEKVGRTYRIEFMGKPNTGVEIHVRLITPVVVIVEMKNGKLECDSLKGGIIEIINGGVHIDRTSGDTRIKVTNGSVKVGELYSSTFSIRVVNGDIYTGIMGRGVKRGNIRTTNGNIVLGVDKRVSAVLDIYTVNGKVTVEDFYVQNITHRHKKVRINRGGGVIRVQNISEDIKILKY